MPRQPRLDIPNQLYHVIARGIERRAIFSDTHDCNVFLNRLGEIARDTETPIYAFALIPNHFHLLLRRGKTPLKTVMARLLTSYAGRFNKRHQRSGHLFQNRYKSILCQEETFFLELIRYIHLNPLKAGLVGSVEELNRYSYSSHAYLVNRHCPPWYHKDAVLSHFGPSRKQSIGAYLSWLRDGIGFSPNDLDGGGLIRSYGSPANLPQEKQAYDGRILGEGIFVEEALARTTDPLDLSGLATAILDEVCQAGNLSKQQLLGKGRSQVIVGARREAAKRLAGDLGLSYSEIGRLLGVHLTTAKRLILD